MQMPEISSMKIEFAYLLMWHLQSVYIFGWNSILPLLAVHNMLMLEYRVRITMPCTTRLEWCFLALECPSSCIFMQTTYIDAALQRERRIRCAQQRSPEGVSVLHSSSLFLFCFKLIWRLAICTFKVNKVEILVSSIDGVVCKSNAYTSLPEI